MTEKSERKGWLGALVASSLGGIGVMGYLAYIHYQVTGGDSSFSSFCNVNNEINCDAVAASGWSTLFGVPVAIWGIAFYLLFVVIALGSLVAKKPKHAGVYLVWLSLFSVVYTIFLAYVSKALLHTWCILCMVGWGINLANLIFSLMACRTLFKDQPRILWQDVKTLLSKPLRAVVVVVLGLGMVGLLFATSSYEKQQQVKQDKAAPIFKKLDKPLNLTTGYAFGSDKPKVTVVEFSDFQCPHCSHLHKILMKLSKEFPELRVIHKDYPLDHQCHPGLQQPFHTAACLSAMFVRCAGEQGKYWDAFDVAFENQRLLTNQETFERMMTELRLDRTQLLACLDNPVMQQQLQAEIREGMDLQLMGTPAVIINGTEQLMSNWSGGHLKEIIRQKLDEADD